MGAATSASLEINRVVVLGANGAMGAGSAAMFASAGCEVDLVARDLPKVEGAMKASQGIAKSEHITSSMSARTYGEGYGAFLPGADLIFEAVAEEMSLKRRIFAEVDAHRPEDAIVATVSSGLSIREMAEGCSDGFKKHFLGIHLYNPPHVMSGVELIPHPDMDPALVNELAEMMTNRFGRAVVICKDLPAFAGNRIGFKVLNEVAQLAETHGVQLMDTIVGPYTGRAMPPLATIDLVGWDVHKAIVDNVDANIQDEAPGAFKMPAYMSKALEAGHMGDKTPLMGGFFKRSTVDGKAIVQALDPATGNYIDMDRGLTVPFVEQVKELYHEGRYQQGMDSFMSAQDPLADIARKVVLGYASYALHRVGEVVEEYADADRIMTAGFNWAPPSGLVDYIGVDRAIAQMERYGIPVPALLHAAKKGEVRTPLFNLPFLTPGRYFAG
ncbi:MAG: 3-hydroxyacyl-CoA dehydrogenase family protein [Dehalococcoidia bacterium]|nr:3-hydroxyacyl-CoA dehydrogenase family protein [Dehalococcoidia bacterium]MCB9485849.1 3-hydroxyacyl-CoA dehydrogenase family protein [Thermoflexaceae bacterium]